MEKQLSKLVGPYEIREVKGESVNETLAALLYLTLRDLNEMYVAQTITVEQYLNEIRVVFTNSKRS